MALMVGFFVLAPVQSTKGQGVTPAPAVMKSNKGHEAASPRSLDENTIVAEATLTIPPLRIMPSGVTSLTAWETTTPLTRLAIQPSTYNYSTGHSEQHHEHTIGAVTGFLTALGVLVVIALVIVPLCYWKKWAAWAERRKRKNKLDKELILPPRRRRQRMLSARSDRIRRTSVDWSFPIADIELAHVGDRRSASSEANSTRCSTTDEDVNSTAQDDQSSASDAAELWQFMYTPSHHQPEPPDSLPAKPAKPPPNLTQDYSAATFTSKNVADHIQSSFRPSPVRFTGDDMRRHTSRIPLRSSRLPPVDSYTGSRNTGNNVPRTPFTPCKRRSEAPEIAPHSIRPPPPALLRVLPAPRFTPGDKGLRTLGI